VRESRAGRSSFLVAAGSGGRRLIKDTETQDITDQIRKLRYSERQADMRLAVRIVRLAAIRRKRAQTLCSRSRKFG